MEINFWLTVFLYIFLGLLLIINGSNLVKSFVSIIAFIFGFLLTIYLLNIDIYKLFISNKDIFTILISIWIPILIGMMFSFLATFFVRFFVSIFAASVFYSMINFISNTFGFNNQITLFFSIFLAVILFLFVLFTNKFYDLVLIIQTSLWGGFLISNGIILCFLNFYDFSYLTSIINRYDFLIIDIEVRYKILFYIMWTTFFIIGIRVQKRTV